ncbi:MAG: PTS sugar transporter subunit IIC [candidate division Zixibacteria bacterium]|nr:PTS sugar transporter subunit IIC [candidate division Zixibacteria bacterium]
MTEELIIVLILGGLASLDSTEALQSMWSQPLVGATLAGWLLGDWQAGLKIGILFQLIWLWYLPLGANLFPDPAAGGVVAAVSFLHFQNSAELNPNKLVLITVVLGFLFSYGAGWLGWKNRFWNAHLVHRLEEKLSSGKNCLNFYFALSLLISLARAAIISLAGFVLLLQLTELTLTATASLPDSFFDFIHPVLWGFGLGSLFLFFGKPKNLPALLAGLALGVVIFIL